MKIVISLFIVLMVILALKSKADERKAIRELTEKLKGDYGKRQKRTFEPGELEKIAAYSIRILRAETLREDSQYIDDITWHDLGMDDIYAAIDSCSSFSGEDKLYRWLRLPTADREELLYRDKIIKHFDDSPQIRTDYGIKLSSLKMTKGRIPVESVDSLTLIRAEGNGLHYILALAALVSIAVIFIYPTIGLLSFLIVLAINISSYFRRKGEISGQIAEISYILKAIRVSKDILMVSDDGSLRYRQELENAVSLLYRLSGSSFLLTGGYGLTGGVMNMLLDYIRMLFHVDLIVFNNIRNKIIDNKDAIEKMFEAIGTIDAAIAVAAFRRSLKTYCIPSFSDDDKTIEIKGLYHPLLEKPVCCDITSFGGVLVTGCNASGKSTFLKAAATAVLLSQTVYTVPAERYAAPVMRLYSSMALSDDISKGESYYMAEIRSIKRIVDAAEDARPMVCFIDEVLRGTNTVERIAASSEILREILNKGVFCFAATHDVELTSILAGCYDNYHFEEEIEGDDVHFSYKLHKGAAHSRNAIKLLRIMGYGENIVESAEQRAAAFMENGEWEKHE